MKIFVYDESFDNWAEDADFGDVLTDSLVDYFDYVGERRRVGFPFFCLQATRYTLNFGITNCGVLNEAIDSSWQEHFINEVCKDPWVQYRVACWSTDFFHAYMLPSYELFIEQHLCSTNEEAEVMKKYSQLLVEGWVRLGEGRVTIYDGYNTKVKNFLA